jgi:hypothetical protein
MVNGQLHAPAALPPGKSLRYQLTRRIGGPQNRSGRNGEEKNLFSLPEIEPRLLGCPARSLFTSYRHDSLSVKYYWDVQLMDDDVLQRPAARHLFSLLITPSHMQLKIVGFTGRTRSIHGKFIQNLKKRDHLGDLVCRHKIFLKIGAKHCIFIRQSISGKLSAYHSRPIQSHELHFK